jgi:hypothetical protein
MLQSEKIFRKDINIQCIGERGSYVILMGISCNSTTSRGSSLRCVILLAFYGGEKRGLPKNYLRSSDGEANLPDRAQPLKPLRL